MEPIHRFRIGELLQTVIHRVLEKGEGFADSTAQNDGFRIIGIDDGLYQEAEVITIEAPCLQRLFIILSCLFPQFLATGLEGFEEPAGTIVLIVLFLER